MYRKCRTKLSPAMPGLLPGLNDFHFDGIGAFLNLPQMMNPAMAAATILAPITAASPLDT